MIKKIICLIVGLSIMNCLAFFEPVNAADAPVTTLTPVTAQTDWPLKLYTDKLALNSELAILSKDYSGMTDFVVADLGQDKVPEIIVSFGYQAKPMIKVYRLDGSVINEWQPYPETYQGRISLAVADFDNDGQKEIVCAPGEESEAKVKIFDSQGKTKFNEGFLVADKKYTAGVEVAAGDINGDNQAEIVVSVIGDKKFLAKIYDYQGRQLYNTIEMTAEQYFEAPKVAVYDLNDDKAKEIIVGASIGNKPEVHVYNYLGEELGKFMAFAVNFTGGVDVAGFEMYGQPLVAASAGYSGGPHVRFYNINGDNLFNPKFFVYDSSFRGGVNLSSFDNGSTSLLAVLPQTIAENSKLSSFGKVIKVDLSEQKLYAYDKGRLVKSFLISSGKRGFDTPIGTFHVYRKRVSARMAWNYGPNNPNNYDLPNVPHILSFSGSYTIHGAYWHNNWGRRMSHGCVNVSLPMAKWIYDWTPMGTPVIIQA